MADLYSETTRFTDTRRVGIALGGQQANFGTLTGRTTPSPEGGELVEVLVDGATVSTWVDDRVPWSIGYDVSFSITYDDQYSPEDAAIVALSWLREEIENAGPVHFKVESRENDQIVYDVAIEWINGTPHAHTTQISEKVPGQTGKRRTPAWAEDLLLKGQNAHKAALEKKENA